MRWLLFAVGIAVIAGTGGSLMRSLIVPRGLSSHLTTFIGRATRKVFIAASHLFESYRRKDRVLAFYAPVTVIALLGTWLVLFVLGFALAMMPFVTDSYAHAVRETAGSMLTLGNTVRGGGAVAVCDLAAGAGLITVAMLIAYLPTMYNAFNRRETLVTTLQTRAGAPAWGPEILARHHLVASLDNLPRFYADWEYWAADVAESHTTYPVMIYFRSPHPLRSWLIGLLAVMDSAALYHSISPSRTPAEARICLRQGFTTLRDIARVAGIPFDPDPLPDTPIELTFEEFLAGYERLRTVQFPMDRTAEEAWPHFRGWRVNYESTAYALADRIVAPPGLWSGARTHVGGGPIDPMRPVDRKPGDPETARAPRLRSDYPL
jgi:hypothetical protein